MRLVALALLVACSSKDAGAPVGGGSDPQDGTFAVEREDMPDDAWGEAAIVVGKKWRASMRQKGISRLHVKPLKSPDGKVVPYLFEVDGGKGGTSSFHSTALIANGEMINSNGPARATSYLAGLGFPKTQLNVGHLVEILSVLKAIDGDWLKPPSTAGWDDKSATLEYKDDGAVLTLTQGDKKLVVTFAKDATFTKSS